MLKHYKKWQILHNLNQFHLTPFFCLVNWDMYYPGSALRGTDLPPGRILSLSLSLSLPLSLSLSLYIYIYISVEGRRMIGISRSLIWSKTLMELIFNPCGEFWWSPEGPVSQIHSPHLHVGAPGNLSDLLRSVQMLKKEWGAESNRKLPHLFNGKTSVLVLEFVVEDLPSAERQLRFLCLQWRTCPWEEHSWWWYLC